MRGYIDLHCHFLAGIDDGARSEAEGISMLRELGKLGFSKVIATPHMRPGMFENTKDDLVNAYQRMLPRIEESQGLPETALASEHYFDDVVFGRIIEQQVLPYPGDQAILLEFYENSFPAYVEQRLFDIQRRGLRPVIAHPERYRAIWRKPEILERLVSLGSAALLDTGSLVGKYGSQPKRCARELLSSGLYHAACSDAHRPNDAVAVGRGMKELEKLEGPESLDFYYRQGPTELLSGLLPE